MPSAGHLLYYTDISYCFRRLGAYQLKKMKDQNKKYIQGLLR